MHITHREYFPEAFSNIYTFNALVSNGYTYTHVHMPLTYLLFPSNNKVSGTHIHTYQLTHVYNIINSKDIHPQIMHTLEYIYTNLVQPHLLV